MLTVQANGVADYVSAVLRAKQELFATFGDEDVWYRGVNDSALSLLPGAYWRRECDEDSLFFSFKAMVPSYVGREPTDEWEWYYLMQHYRLPTRLLDWTESALTALWFAVSTCVEGKSPAVWIMMPGQLNKLTHKHENTRIFVPGRRADLDEWLPPACGRDKDIRLIDGSNEFNSNELPIAIFPKRSNPRIVAQRGTFTIHGVTETPIDTLLRENGGDQPPLIRVDLVGLDVDAWLSDLWSLGVDRSALFPEPESVAEDLKRTYGVA